jgi:hypothetical protein
MLPDSTALRSRRGGQTTKEPNAGVARRALALHRTHEHAGEFKFRPAFGYLRASAPFNRRGWLKIVESK